MDRRNFALGKTNFIILAVGMVIVIIGFILMSGAGSDESVFSYDLFSARHKGGSRCMLHRICLYNLRHHTQTQGR